MSSQSESNAVTRNYHEAFNSPTADFVICSSDNVYFHAHRLIVSEASSVFDGMFALPTSPPSLLLSTKKSAELPVVTLSEDAETLEGLLRVCYPAKASRIANLGALRKIMGAAEKYMIQGAVELLGMALTDHTLIEEEPMRAYALACRFRLRSAAVTAAKASLRHPCPTQSFPELAEASAQAYHDLLSYRKKCLNAFDTVMHNSDSLWRNLTPVIAPFPDNNRPYRPRFKEILQDDVCGKALTSPTSLRHLAWVVSENCQECYVKRMPDILECHAKVAVVLDREIGKIALDLSW